MQRRTLIWSLVAMAIALGAIVLGTRDTPERLIQARIEQLALALTTAPADDEAGKQARIERAFGEAVVDDVMIEIPELSLSRGRAELVSAAKRAVSDPRGLEVTTEAVRVELDPNEREATALLRARVSRPGDELHEDVRQVRLRLAKSGEDWRVTSVAVSAAAEPEPEARP